MDPTEEFYLDDLFPLLRNEISLREFLLKNEHYVPKNYMEGNFTSAGIIGHGIQVSYERSFIRSGPAYEESVYEGDFLYDMQHGYGEYISETLKYKGDFFANEFHGTGRRICHYSNSIENGIHLTDSIYTGEFVCGLSHGHGQLLKLYEDGSAKVYEGNFDAGRLADGSQTVKIYHGLSKEENTELLESGSCEPVSLPEEKFAESIQVKYLHGEEVEQ